MLGLIPGGNIDLGHFFEMVSVKFQLNLTLLSDTVRFNK